MESKIRYLEMIQNVITRMASNSFLLKGWTVTLVVGLLAFANVDDMDSKYIIIAVIPTIFFWVLDGYFIYQERLFRGLYAKAATIKDETKVNFSMNTEPYKSSNGGVVRAIFSNTLLIFYIPIIIVILLAILSFPYIKA